MKKYKPTPEEEPDQLRRYQREARLRFTGREHRALRGQLRRVLVRLRQEALRQGTLGHVHFSIEKNAGRVSVEWTAYFGLGYYRSPARGLR